jgi:hypothetical protein
MVKTPMPSINPKPALHASNPKPHLARHLVTGEDYHEISGESRPLKR